MKAKIKDDVKEKLSKPNTAKKQNKNILNQNLN